MRGYLFSMTNKTSSSKYQPPPFNLTQDSKAIARTARDWRIWSFHDRNSWACQQQIRCTK